MTGPSDFTVCWNTYRKPIESPLQFAEHYTKKAGRCLTLLNGIYLSNCTVLSVCKISDPSNICIWQAEWYREGEKDILYLNSPLSTNSLGNPLNQIQWIRFKGFLYLHHGIHCMIQCIPWCTHGVYTAQGQASVHSNWIADSTFPFTLQNKVETWFHAIPWNCIMPMIYDTWFLTENNL